MESKFEFRRVLQFVSEERKQPVDRALKRRQHRKKVDTITASLLVPNRRVLFCGWAQGRVEYWRTEQRNSSIAPTPRPLTDPSIAGALAHKGSVTSLSFLTVDSHAILCTGSADTSVKLWNCSSRIVRDKDTLLQTLRKHSGTVTGLAAVKGSLLSGGTDQTIILWRPSINPKHTPLMYPWYQAVQQIQLTAWATALVPRTLESAAFFVGDSNGRVHTYYPDSLSLSSDGLLHSSSHAAINTRVSTAVANSAQRHQLGITSMHVIPEEQYMITLSYDSTVQVVDVSTGNGVFGAQNSNKCCYTGLVWLPVPKFLVLGDAKGHVQIWDIHEEYCLFETRLLREPIFSLHVDPSWRIYATGANAVSVYELRTEQYAKAFPAHMGAVVTMAFVETASAHETSGRELVLYSASVDNTIRCWEMRDYSCLSILRERRAEITCLLHLPNTSIIFTGHENGVIRAWNIESGHSQSWKLHTNTVSSMAVVKHNRSNYLVSGSYDTYVNLCEINSRHMLAGEPEMSIKVADDEVLVVYAAHHPRTGVFLTAGNDTIIRIWEVEGKEPMALLRGHTDSVTSLTMDGELVFSASEDGTIKVWHYDLHYNVATIRVDDDSSIRCMSILPVVGHIVSVDSRGNLVMRDGQTHKVIHSHENLPGVCCMLYKADENTMLLGCHDGSISFVSLPVPAITTQDRCRVDHALHTALYLSGNTSRCQV